MPRALLTWIKLKKKIKNTVKKKKKNKTNKIQLKEDGKL